ncbi:MAG: 16S rRNA (guanine(966)-N(2))-methyltransferase RsmD [Clostridiales bacterium]|nr:16S rRNA (guanine(966)-N(2))-methyltransferase RsmD [Clostridiales bacterium]MBS5877128.1 16S rRNA (guanine(966)-N(2))-methyltransferase RsmD [Clostridiales bacterium]
MRVIAGTARSMPLKTIKSMETRPTTDRIKETIFNILMPDLPGARFLDLFAGAGSIGIEALSRGASKAVFVEKSKEACEIIDHNLNFTRLSDKGEVKRRDVFDALMEMNGSGAFDIIFIDPPYGRRLGFDVLQVIKKTDLADEDTLIVLEEDLSDEIREGAVISGFEVKRIKQYRANRHIFFRKEVK